MNKYTLYNRKGRLYARINRDKFFSLGLKVPENAMLNFQTKKIDGSSSLVHKINVELSRWDLLFNKYITRSPEDICRLWSPPNETKKNHSGKQTFVNLFEDIYDKMYNGIILNDGNLFTMTTLKTYVCVYHILQTFPETIYVDDIDEGSTQDRKEKIKRRSELNGYFNAFNLYSMQLGNKPSSRRNQIKILKSILNKAMKFYGYYFTSPPKPKELKSPVIALEPSDVEMLHKNPPVDIKLTKAWYYTRFMLHSCMRISDMIGFKISKGDDYITYISKKSTSQSTFYLPKDVREYLLKNENGYTMVGFRNDLKRLLKSYDEFKKEKSITTFDVQGNPVVKILPIYEVITPHKLRSSGITWYLSLGYTEKQVREISGHSNGSVAFYRYTDHTDAKTKQRHADTINELLKV